MSKYEIIISIITGFGVLIATLSFFKSCLTSKELKGFKAEIKINTSSNESDVYQDISNHGTGTIKSAGGDYVEH